MPPHSTSSQKPVDHLTPDEARAEHGRLGAEIAEHDALRKRYEALEDQYPELKTPESLTQKVGSKVSEKFGKIRHRVPMLSLDNGFADEEVEEFVERIRRFLNLKDDTSLAFTAEPKIDGLSLS